jgi:predicted nicotinamide N-methyase
MTLSGRRCEFVLPFPTCTVRLRTALVDDHETLAAADREDLHWATLWPASLALAAALLERRFALPAGEALELGCGTGLAGIALALTGGRVCASDRAPAALDLVRANAVYNGVGERVRTQVLDWNTPPAGRWPLIMAADVLYQPDAGRAMARLLQTTLADDGIALITDPDRPGARHFHLMAQEAGLVVDLRRMPVPFVDTHGPVTVLAGAAASLAVTLFVLRRSAAGRQPLTVPEAG